MEDNINREAGYQQTIFGSNYMSHQLKYIISSASEASQIEPELGTARPQLVWSFPCFYLFKEIIVSDCKTD
jgi:hypothetical protein